MPNCVECGKEMPREVMYGPPDELRCQACAQRITAIYNAPRRELPAATQPVITIAVMAASVVGTLAYWQNHQWMAWAIGDPWQVWSGQLWRYFTTTFLHGNFFHLAFNLYWLWIFGRDLEAWLGHVRYAGLIVLLAVGGSAGELLLSAQTGIGLSGVGYGLFGILFSLRHDKEFAALLMSSQTVQLFVFWFFLCIVLTYTNIMPVANAAHGVGAVAGWLVGQALLQKRRLLMVAGVCCGVLLLVGISMYMPWNGRYDWYRGYVAFHKNDLREALYWYDKAQRAMPDNPDIREIVQWLRENAARQEREAKRQAGPE